MSYNTIGLIQTHDASISVLEDGFIKHHLKEERFSKRKHDTSVVQSLLKLKTYYNKNINLIGSSDLSSLVDSNEQEYKHLYNHHQIHYHIEKLFNKKTKSKEYKSKLYLSSLHHLMHASCAFYNSGFQEALCFVFDGHGNIHDIKVENTDFLGLELQSCYYFSYPCNHELVYKYLYTKDDLKQFNSDTLHLDKNNSKIILSNIKMSLGLLFQNLCKHVLELNEEDAGKAMGWASYGNRNYFNGLPKFFVNNKINKPYNLDNPTNIFKYNLFKGFETKANLALYIQDVCSQIVLDVILKCVEKTGIKNVCLSGGYALNVVTNNFLLKNLPPDIKFYVEPVSADDGISIGVAKYAFHLENQDSEIRKQSSIFYGLEYDLNIPSHIDQQKASYHDVATLISKGHYVALFQNKSESGPRALGHRSLLFNPTLEDGKDRLNVVKKREWYRPFAGSVLEEKASDWFHMHSLTSSPHMMYALDVKEEKSKMIPAIVHVDNTCRIQTVNKLTDPHFYSIIKEFENITNVPIVMNTSFNLAGETMVETVEDAISTLERSEIEYCYFPETQTLIYIKNEDSTNH